MQNIYSVKELSNIKDILSNREYQNSLRRVFCDFFYDYNKSYKNEYLKKQTFDFCRKQIDLSEMSLRQLLYLIDVVNMYTSYKANKILNKLKSFKGFEDKKTAYILFYSDVSKEYIEKISDTGNRQRAFVKIEENSELVYGVYYQDMFNSLNVVDITNATELDIFKVLKDVFFNYYVDENELFYY